MEVMVRLQKTLVDLVHGIVVGGSASFGDSSGSVADSVAVSGSSIPILVSLLHWR